MNQIDDRQLKIVLRELEETLDSDGDVVEMGCYEGTTSLSLAKILSRCKSDKKLYLYDSFEGLPEKSLNDLSPAGDKFTSGELRASKSELMKKFKRSNLPMPIVKKAWFSDLTPDDVPDEICFAFLDGDYYLSIRDSLRLVSNKMNDNGVIIVHDYQSGALPGVEKAVNEWLAMNCRYKLTIENGLAILR